MQRNIPLKDIDWVFCWRTSTGQVRPGERDTTFNGKRVPYAPAGTSPENGLLTIVDGRMHTRPREQLGFKLNDQGAISRMAIFLWGHITHPSVIPARDLRELELLEGAARAAIASRDADEWALVCFHARGQTHWAIHIDAPVTVVGKLAAIVDAPWTLNITEKHATRKNGTSWPDGVEIHGWNQQGHPLETLSAQTYFDEAPLPAFALAQQAERAKEAHTKPYATPMNLWHPPAKPDGVTEAEHLDAITNAFTDQLVETLAAQGLIMEDDLRKH